MMQKFGGEMGWAGEGGEGSGETWLLKNPAAPKFSRPIRLLDSFTQNLSIMISTKISIMIATYSINFGYC